MTEQHNQTSGVSRSVDDSIVAGVCGGLGDRFGVSAWWFRWAFIVLTIFGLAGVYLYLLAWVLVPKETEDESVVSSWLGDLDLTDVGTIFGIVLIGVAGVIILNMFFHVSRALVAAGVLAVVGVLLYRGDVRPPDTPRAGGPHNVDEDESSPDAEPSSAGAAAATAVVTKPPKPKKEKKERVRKPRPPKSMLGRLTMAVALIALSGMALIDLAGWARFEPVEYLAAGMGIIALGLLVGAWIGRARWLIIIGILLAPWLFFASLLPNIADWSFGDPYYQPQTVDEVQDSYSLSIGDLDLDLTGLSEEQLAEVGTIEASVGLGQLDVRVPLGVGVIVRAVVGAGSIETFVDFDVVHVGPPIEVQRAIEDCIHSDAGYFECQQLLFVSNDRWNGEYPWNAYVYDSGVDIERDYQIGTPPVVLELNLSVGVGEITVQQNGEQIVYQGLEG